MICYNQHCSCQLCLSTVYHKNVCPICNDNLIPKHKLKLNKLLFSLIHNFKQHSSTLDNIEIRDKNHKKSLYTKHYRHLLEGELNNNEEGKCKFITKEGNIFEGTAHKQNLTGVFKTLSGATVEGKIEMESMVGLNCVKKYPNGDVFQGRVEKLKA